MSQQISPTKVTLHRAAQNKQRASIFNVLSSYVETNSVGICTDGAPSMVGSIMGFASRVKKENPDVTTHCFIQRGAGFENPWR
jgi:hypothetical protein